jgi:hypothetical protein
MDVGMNRIRKSIYIIPIVAVIVACGVDTSAPTVAATQVIQPSSDTSNTKAPSTPTITVLPSATKRVEGGAPESCIDLNLTDFNPKSINGFLAVWDSNDATHLLDVRTKQFLDVDKNGNQIFSPHHISPNKKYLLAEDTTGDYFILRTADEVIRKNIPFEQDWLIPGWIDNEHVVFLSLKEPKQDVIILNPFTGEQDTIHVNIPDANIERFSSVYRVVYYFIDPTLKRVFYNDQVGNLILRDLGTQKEIISLPPNLYASFLFSNVWSPDRTTMVTPWPERGALHPPANELYILNLDGKFEQLTKLNQKYAFANIEEPSWSPDGRHIGFWLRIGDGKSDPLKLRQWLAVFDTDSLETTIYCLADKLQPWEAGSVVWSPDGQQLIVNFGSRLDNTLESILVDLPHQTQAVINTQNMEVNDWMAP